VICCPAAALAAGVPTSALEEVVVEARRVGLVGIARSAGSVDLVYRRTLREPVASLTAGEDNYYRGLLAGSADVGEGSFLVGVDYSSTDGPWDLEQDFRKLNGLVKYTRGDDDRGVGITAIGYDGDWRSADQIPLRAIHSGELSRFGYVDATDGGDSRRYSLSLDAWSREDGRGWSANAYAVDYGLDLFSNFTYALDEENGDQCEQFDSRRIFGGSLGGNWKCIGWQREVRAHDARKRRSRIGLARRSRHFAGHFQPVRRRW
jgi:hypothetical protein